jgi:hypothetical protein
MSDDGRNTRPAGTTNFVLGFVVVVQFQHIGRTCELAARTSSKSHCSEARLIRPFGGWPMTTGTWGGSSILLQHQHQHNINNRDYCIT